MKRLILKRFLSLLSLLMFFGASFFGAISAPEDVHASPIDELRDQISNRNTSIKQLEAQIRQYEQTLGTLNEQSDTLETAISSINTNVDRVQANISLTKNKIQAAILQLEKIHLEIEEKRKKIERNESLVADTIRTIDRRESETLVEILLKHDNISAFWEKLDSLSQFQEGLGTEIQNLKQLKSSIEEKEVLAESNRRELLGFQTDLVRESKLLQNTKQEKSFLLKKTENQEDQYQSLLAENKKRKQEFEQQLADLESKLQVALNPALLPEKGVQALSWPVQGPITQRFGRTSASGRLYASGTHNGLDIGVPVGTPIKAAAAGTVMGARNTDEVCRGASYGRYVFIKHNNGLSTISAHLSSINVSEGQAVTRGQIIGYSGASGYVTGPHLHFGVYASQAVRMATLQSGACAGATYHIPIAPHNGYLAPLEYLN